MKTKSLQFDESRKAIISLSYRFDGYYYLGKFIISESLLQQHIVIILFELWI